VAVCGYDVTPDRSRDLIIELRGFAPIGIMEYWNYGIMGSGKMGHCYIGKIFLDKKSNK
jgi:hypothetical protein